MCMLMLLLLQWLMSLLSSRTEGSDGQAALQQATSQVFTALLSAAGPAATAAAGDASATAAGRGVPPVSTQGPAQELVKGARGFHQLLMQLQPSSEQLLAIRGRVAPQALLGLAADDARVEAFLADYEVRGGGVVRSTLRKRWHSKCTC